jgi:pectate lyase
MDSPNTSPDGDYEIDGFANLGASKPTILSKPRSCAGTNDCLENDWGPAKINITKVGNFTCAPYRYNLTPLRNVQEVVKTWAGLNKI